MACMSRNDDIHFCNESQARNERKKVRNLKQVRDKASRRFCTSLLQKKVHSGHVRMQQFQKIKLYSEKKHPYCHLVQAGLGSSVSNQAGSVDFLFGPLIFLQSLDQNKCLVPHLKDLTHICLEPAAQGCLRTFRMLYLASK